MIKFIAIAVLAYSTSSSAYTSWGGNQGINLGSDTIRTSQGASCSSNNNSDKRLELGTMSASSSERDSSFSSEEGRNNGVFAKFTYTFGSERGRVDCSLLYNLEVSKQQLEIELLREELKLAKVRTINEAKGEPPTSTSTEEW